MVGDVLLFGQFMLRFRSARVPGGVLGSSSRLVHRPPGYRLTRGLRRSCELRWELPVLRGPGGTLGGSGAHCASAWNETLGSGVFLQSPRRSPLTAQQRAGLRPGALHPVLQPVPVVRSERDADWLPRTESPQRVMFALMAVRRSISGFCVPAAPSEDRRAAVNETVGHRFGPTSAAPPEVPLWAWRSLVATARPPGRADSSASPVVEVSGDGAGLVPLQAGWTAEAGLRRLRRARRGVGAAPDSAEMALTALTSSRLARMPLARW